jgi:hypothetical protein
MSLTVQERNALGGILSQDIGISYDDRVQLFARFH